MHSDDVVWSIIGQQFCSYKVKSTTHNTFCRNEYNLTGLCSRTFCPLANARYATVREREGVVYLYVKTAERAHMPARQWERIKLSTNEMTALEQINTELQYWPKGIRNMSKLRLLKIRETLVKLRKLKRKAEEQPQLVGIKSKTERREATRELKALKAAKLPKSIEAELVRRLKTGVYGEIDDVNAPPPLNVNEEAWREFLESRHVVAGGKKGKGKGKGGDGDGEGGDGIQLEDEESESEDEEEIEALQRELDEMDDLEEEEDVGVGDREFVSDDESDEEGDLEDLYDSDGNSIHLSEEGDSDDEDDDVEDDAAGGSKRKRPAGPTGKGPVAGPKSKKSKGGKGGKPQLEIEYEEETEPLTKEQLASW